MKRTDLASKRSATSSMTHSLWIESISSDHYSSLEGEIQADVVIIGAGITGLTAAGLLKRAGKKIAVLELNRVGQGETGHTTAHLTEVLDMSYQDLIRNFGIEGARLACQSSRKAIQRIEANIREHQINCHFKRVPAWIFTEQESEVDWLSFEAEAALKLSVPNTLSDYAPLPFSCSAALRFDHQAQFHPLLYLSSLAKTISGEGSYVFENTRALEIEEGDLCRVHTEHGLVVAKKVIVAANVPIMNKFFLHTKIAAYRSYAIAFPAKDTQVKNHLLWDTVDPYHYIRTETLSGRDYIIVGGEDHKTGQDTQTDDHFRKLEEWSAKRFDVEAVPYRWSGQIVNPIDGLPYVGKNAHSENVFVATGYSGNGMTFGTMAGMLLSDLILEQQNPWSQLYDATRVKPFTGIGTFISENVDFPTRLISDRLSPAEEDLAQIRENEGALIRVGAKKVAAYRDLEGQTHLLSPVCPHLGCYVHWNTAEKSWDCPCHGSRFDPFGKLLNGPAVSDLSPEEADDDLLYAPEGYEAPVDRMNPLMTPLFSFMCPLKTKLN